METDEHDVSNTCKDTTSPSENSCLNDVSAIGRSDCRVEQHKTPLTENVQHDNHIYRQDVVRRNDESMIGVVIDVAGDSDSESDITEDDEDSEEDDKKEEEVEEEEDEEEEGKGEDESQEEWGNIENEGVRNGKADESNGDNGRGRNGKRGRLLADQVRVLWMDDSETTDYQSYVTVVDRSFLQGDYVASSLDPTGQVGIVVDVNMSVDLLAPDGSIVKEVSSKDLKHIRDITVSDFVVFGPWLGRVDDVIDNVTVLFDDGSVCKVMRAEPFRLQPIARNFLDQLEDGHCTYHPGQRVRGSSSTVFKNARWLCGTWKANRLEGTVIKVTVGSVYVHWIASSGYGPESSVSPAEEQSPNNLKLLSCFTHSNWQLGGWCLLPSLALSSCIPFNKGLFKLQLLESSAGPTNWETEEVVLEEPNGHESMDVDGVGAPKYIDENAQNNASPKSSSCGSSMSVMKDSAHESWHIHRKKLRNIVVRRDKKMRKKEEIFERALLIVNTRTTVDVAWQDGTVVRGINSTSLIPIESPGDHDFIAEQYVVEKAADESDETSEIRRVGVVKSVNAKEKTASVRWLKHVIQPDDPREFEKEEIVSVYELEGHPDYDYCYGDVVVRLASIVIAVEGLCSDSGKDHELSNISVDIKQASKSCSKDREANTCENVGTELSDLSWVGNITGIRNGDIEVTWADGMVSTVGPQAVYVVGRDDDASILAGSEISDGASWETVDDDEMGALENFEEEPLREGPEINRDAEEDVLHEEETSGKNGPLAIPFSCIDFVTKLASGIFQGCRNENSCGLNSSGEKQLLLQEEMHICDGRASRNISYAQDPAVIDDVNGDTNLDTLEEPADAESVKLLDIADGEAELDLSPKGLDVAIAFSFKCFDIAKDPADNYFLETNITVNTGRKWLKQVHRDWNILQNNLPDGIYVRVYEDRMDLLRAVIVGAYGTPYQDGIFCFDFHLPLEYPDVPPSVHYHSGGWKINPNLYEEGKVCLSLLNTWTGKGNEVWDPQSSSILQVLVSLQGLVLNSRPYFNEAGYDRQIGTAEGEKNSLSYNENTFLLNCKTIMYLIRKPPKDFEFFVKQHFKQHGYYILKACDAYMKGYLIGSLSKDASVTDKSEENATSVGFKLMLTKIMPKLVCTLSEVGADCQGFKPTAP